MLLVSKLHAYNQRYTYICGAYNIHINIIDFVVLEHEMQTMTWGQATIYIQQKITESHNPKKSESDEEDD